ncbi:MAG: IS4 family transposase [Verrucomicrobia bacterium]|nr:IS4 family transposase [Verrucomicrobiota bacterium]
MTKAPCKSDWTLLESKGVDCGDKRLDRRFATLLQTMAKTPGASIPQACGGDHAQIAAAYRFLSNPSVTPHALLSAHAEQTTERISAHPTVLLVQDTTEIDMSQPEQRILGAGPLDDSLRQGALLHLLHAFTPEGSPLGSLWHKIVIRPERPKGKAAKRPTRAQRQRTPIEDKESYRWLEGLAAARSRAQDQEHTRFICVADSEADIYEYLQPSMIEGQSAPLYWIVRAFQDRALQSQAEGDDAEKSIPEVSRLWEACAEAPIIALRKLRVRGRKAKLMCDKRSRRQPREDRDIEVEVRVRAGATLRPPARHGHRLEPACINAVLVREKNPPEGDVAVEWLLLTTLPVRSEQEVSEIIEAYAKRFMIEVLFRTLKSGCRIEDRRFESASSHLSHLAIALIIAWRVMWLSQIAQNEPEKEGGSVFSEAEWRVAWLKVKGAKEPMPKQVPSAGEIIKLVAKLGGWIERGGKYASPPGVQTLWQGLRRVEDMAAIWSLQNPSTCV